VILERPHIIDDKPMALNLAFKTLTFGRTSCRVIPALSLIQPSSVDVVVPRRTIRDVRWAMTNPKLGKYGAYPATTMWPTTDKTELAEMSESDPRRFSEIRALESYDYVACFQDPVIEKFIRKMINKKGSKSRDRFQKHKTRELMYNCMEFIKYAQLEKYHAAVTQEEKDAIEVCPYKIIYGALENGKPLLNVIDKRKAAVMYRVPIPVPEDQQFRKAVRWFIEAGRLNKYFEDAHTARRLAEEFLNGFENTGKVIRQKQELHKEAEANKAYAHFRWGDARSNRKR